MDWNNETIEQLTELAKLPSLTPSMIARILGLNEADFFDALEDKEHPICIAYDRGQLLALAEFDKKVIQLSQQGSGPAQTLLKNIKKDTEYYKLLEKYGK